MATSSHDSRTKGRSRTVTSGKNVVPRRYATKRPRGGDASRAVRDPALRLVYFITHACMQCVHAREETQVIRW